MKLYVGRLPYQTTGDDLEQIFGRYGEVLSASVITDRDTGRSRGFGFVEMSNDEDARSAMNNLNNSDLEGRTIVVNEANERPPRTGGGNRGGGGGFQNRERRSYDRGSGGGGGYRDRRY